MIDAKAKGFSVRPANTDIFFGWDSPTGQPVNDKTLTDCLYARLEMKEQRVLVEDVSTDNRQTFTGRVRGFYPAVVEIFEGMSIGEKIEFEESHIFSAFD
jgi:hypothetical protein